MLGINIRMRKATNTILIVTAIFTCLIMLYGGEPSSIDWWRGIAGHFGWACLPYGILLFFNMIKRGVFKKDFVLLVTTIIVSGFALFIYVDTFFIHLDAQGGLIFLFLPMYQIIASIFGGLTGLGFYVRSSNAQPPAARDGA